MIGGQGSTTDEPRAMSSGPALGSLGTSDDPGRMLDGCRQYLLMIANEVIGPELQAKVGASDLVQDTFLEAQRHLGAFRGRTTPRPAPGCERFWNAGWPTSGARIW